MQMVKILTMCSREKIWQGLKKLFLSMVFWPESESMEYGNSGYGDEEALKTIYSFR